MTGWEKFSAKCRLDLLTMIQNAGSGHPGGALSSVDLLIALYSACPGDRVIVSHGHIAAAVYSVLGNSGYFDVTEAIAGFRRAGTPYEGHPNTSVPGVEWCSGALGQGLSVGAGFAAGERLARSGRHVWVLMGDGEQNKGQLHEARHIAAKFGLNNLTAIVDLNGLQASGSTAEIYPDHVAETYRTAGWRVIECDGHDVPALAKLFQECRNAGEPCAVIAHTVMGKGVPEIENDYEYHGKLLPADLFEKVRERLEAACAGNTFFPPAPQVIPSPDHKPLQLPPFSEYTKKSDCRSAFGDTLAAIVGENPSRTAAIDCDLEASVKLKKYRTVSPERFFECGIAEQNAAAFAAGLSKTDPAVFWADFAVFGMNEVLGVLRMADFNHTAMKVVCTHCGADVGEDGKTHQATDYLALARTLPSFKLLAPADANQCEHMVRYAAQQQENIFLVMGRSALPILQERSGKSCFGAEYQFEYGKADLLRSSDQDCAALITYGTMVPAAVKLADELAEEGIHIRVLSCGTPLEVDREALTAAAQTGHVVVWEDHRQNNGLGELLAAWFFENGLTCRFKRFGLTKTGISASPAEQYQYQGISPEDVKNYLINHI